MPEKLIDQVEVELLDRNLTNGHTIHVKSFGRKNKYVLSLNPLVMEFGDFKSRIRKEIQRGMAEMLLFDQRHRAPMTLLDGMVEYINELASFGGPKPVFKLRDFSEKCWEDKDPRVVAKFLANCEERSKGCVGRLNQEIHRDGWYEDKIDKVLGFSAIHLCAKLSDFVLKGEDVSTE
ncbi:Ribosome maturation factor RimP [Bienertia sinuspersici]